jgi:hypothetical protein
MFYRIFDASWSEVLVFKMRNSSFISLSTAGGRRVAPGVREAEKKETEVKIKVRKQKQR